MLKSTTKALGKSVKYVHGEIIERKMCGEFHGRNCPGLLSRGKIFKLSWN